MASGPLSLGIDTGGAFADILEIDGGSSDFALEETIRPGRAALHEVREVGLEPIDGKETAA